ncbi:MAG: hypothetical protein ACRCSN_07195 [Dermatophilaceae bacterium]
MPYRDSEPSRTPIGLGLLTAAAIGTLASVVGVVSLIVGIGSSVSATSGTAGPLLAGAALRTLLTLAVVAGVVMVTTMLSGRGSTIGWAGFATLGLVLDVWAWGGNPLFAATLLSGGAAEQGLLVRVVGLVIDLGIWATVAWFAARFGLTMAERRREGAGRLS